MRTPTFSQRLVLEWADGRAHAFHNEDGSALLNVRHIIDKCASRGWITGQYPDLRLTDAGRTALETARITSHDS